MKKVKMKVNLYIDGIQVASVKREVNSDVLKEIYRVRIIGHREIFNKFMVKASLKPMQVIANNEKEIDLNCAVYGGVNID